MAIVVWGIARRNVDYHPYFTSRPYRCQAFGKRETGIVNPKGEAGRRPRRPAFVRSL